MVDRIRKAWGALRAWCATYWLELVGVGLAILAAVGMRRRKPKVHTLESDLEHIADTIRPKIEQAAEEKRAESEVHRQVAEEKVREADAEPERVRTMPAEDLLKESNERLRTLRNGGALLALLAALGAPLGARAQGDIARAPGPNGEPGWWLPDDFYRHVYGGFLEGEKLRLEALPELRSALAACRAEADIRRDAVLFERGVAEVATAKLAVANERLELAERWFRSPAFLVPVGVVIGGLVVGGVAAAVAR